MNEIIEVWCMNDASNAVGVVNGESFCATCIVYAKSEAAKALLRDAVEAGIVTLDKDGKVITDPAFAAELRLNRMLEGRDPITGKLPVEVEARTLWDRAQEVIALRDAGKLDELTDDELSEAEDMERSALYAYPTTGGRESWEALNAEIGRRMNEGRWTL